MCFDCADEELRSVGVRPGVGHGQDPGGRVLQGEVLVFKLVAVDGFSPCSIMVGEIASLRSRQQRQRSAREPAAGHLDRTHLAHELRDNAMEGGAFVAEALLASAEGPEVLRSFRYHITVELQEERRSVRFKLPGEALNEPLQVETALKGSPTLQRWK